MNIFSKVLYVLSTSILLIGFCSCSKEDEGPEILWERTYGGANYDTGYGIEQASDGGFVIAGFTNSFGIGNTVMYVITIDSDGDTVWTKIYGISYEAVFSIDECADGGYVIAGYTDFFGAGGGDMYVIRIDDDGNSLWSQAYGGDSFECARSIKQTSDGGFIITGYTKSYGAGMFDVYLVKTNAAGDTVWTRTYGGAEQDFGKSVCETADGGYVVTGWTSSFGDNDDVYVIRTDADGDTLWTKAHGGPYQDYGEEIITSQDNGFIIAGVAGDPTNHVPTVLLLKLDENGDTVWISTFDDGRGYDVKQTNDGGYIIAGGHYVDSHQNVYLVKVNSTGDIVWEKSIGGNASDRGYSVLETSNGGFIAVGATESYGAGESDIYVVKTAPHIE